jgi:hypothetical protein
MAKKHSNVWNSNNKNPVGVGQAKRRLRKQKKMPSANEQI